MSGPTQQQTELGDAQLAAYKQATQLTQEQYGDYKAITGPMVTQLSSIYAKGPDQEGFTAAEKGNLNAEAIEGTAQNYSQAAKAVGEQTAALGGGTNPLPTGAQIQLRQQVANSAAQQESTEESQIEQADYTQGHSDWDAAGAGLQAIAAGENPAGYEAAETGAGSADSSTEAAIASEDDSWLNAALGAAGSIGGMAAGAAIK